MKTNYVIFAITILWIFASIIDGKRAARAATHNNQKHPRLIQGFYDLYMELTVPRLFSIVVSTACVAFASNLFESPSPFISSFGMMTVMVCMFSYFHDGSFYHFSSKYRPGIFSKGWSDHMKDGKSLNHQQRYTVMMIGIVVFMIIFLMNAW